VVRKENQKWRWGDFLSGPADLLNIDQDIAVENAPGVQPVVALLKRQRLETRSTLIENVYSIRQNDARKSQENVSHQHGND